MTVVEERSEEEGRSEENDGSFEEGFSEYVNPTQSLCNFSN